VNKQVIACRSGLDHNFQGPFSVGISEILVQFPYGHYKMCYKFLKCELMAQDKMSEIPYKINNTLILQFMSETALK